MNTEETEISGPPTPPTPAVPTAPPILSGGTTSPPPLRRSSTNRMVGGVCGGIADRYGFDPAILRVAVVVAVFAGGLGLLGYLAAWLLIPADTEPTNSTLTPSLGKLILGVLLGLGAVAGFLGWLGSLGGFTGVVVGGFLVGVAVWLYLRGRPPGGRVDIPPGQASGTASVSLPTASGTPTGFAYGGTGATSAVGTSDSTAVVPPMTPYYQQAPAAPRKQRSYLGLITLLAAVVVAGLMAAGTAAGLFPLSPIVFFAVLLAVVAGGLIVGAFMGRARWLIIPAVLLALLTAASVPLVRAVDSFEGGVGTPVWQPTAASAPLVLGAGSATLDLTAWAANPTVPPPTLATTLSADVRFGEMVVLVPDTWQVVVNADVGTGDISVNNQLLADQNGPGMTYSATLAPAGAQTGAVTLDLSAGLGNIAIRQVPVSATLGATPSPAASGATTAPTAAPSLPAATNPTDAPTVTQEIQP